MYLLRTYKYLLIDLFVLLLISCIPFFWFPQSYMVTGHDAGYPIDIARAYANRFFSWNTVDIFGQDTSMNMGVIPIHTIEAGFHALGFSLYDSQKFSFVFWFIGILLSMYYFVFSLRKHIHFSHFALIASVLYGVNFYLLALWKYGAGTTFSAYIALPLVMSFTLRYFLEGRNPLWWSLGVSLTLFVFNAGAGFSIPLFGGLLVALTLATVFFGLFTPKKTRLSFFIRLGAMLFGVAFFSMLLNAYWIFPFASYVISNYSTDVALHGGTEGLLSWTDSVSKFTSINNLFRLQGFPDWYDTAAPHFAAVITTQPIFILFSLLFAPLSYASLFFARTITEKKILLYFVVLSLLGIFFSAGTHPPTGALFAQLMIHIPGFSIFRSSQYKFIPALYFSFAFLVSYTFCRLALIRFESSKSSVKNSLIKFVSAVVLIGALLSYHYPYFGHELFVWNKPLTTLLKIPDHVFSFGEWGQKALDPEKRILILPRLNSTWKSEVYTWGYSSLYSLFNLIGLRPFVENTNVENEAQLALTNRLYTELLVDGPLLSPIATMLQTPYALLRGDSYYDLFWNRSDRPDEYAHAMDSSSRIRKVWGQGEWSVYALPASNTGKIFSTPAVPVLHGNGNDVISMLLQGYTSFVQLPNVVNTTHMLPASVPIVSETHVISCESCLLDEPQGSPEVSVPRILPGSFLYFLKSMREKSTEDASLGQEALLIKRLGLSLTRAKEAATLIELKRDTRIILETIDRLSDTWVYIDKEFNMYNETNINFSVVSKIDSYATTQKDLLILSVGNAKERVVQAELAGVIGRLDTILEKVKAYRNYWKYRRMYRIPEGVSMGHVFADKLSFPARGDADPVLPTTLSTNGTVRLISPRIEGERISFGIMNFSGDRSLVLEYPEQENLYINRRQKTVITPKGNMFCQIGDVNSFDWQQQYTITAKLDLLVSSDTVLYLKRIKNSEVDPSRSDAELVNPDITFNLRTRDNKSQEYSFSGDSADVGASVYFCTLLPWSADVLLPDISVHSKLNAPLFLGSSVSGVKEATEAGRVSYRRVDPTKYVVDVSHMTFPSILVFNENYNRKWKLYEPHGWMPAPFNTWTDTWFAKPYSDATHFTINGYANAWYLTEKPEGPLVIEFSPQKLFYQGIIVTIVGILFTAGVVLGMIIKRKKRAL